MCGIACIARTDGSAFDTAEGQRQLDELVRILSHRGPDGSQTLLDESVGFAFTRLALVGPDDGDQPFVSDDGALVMVVNGEVYNHRELEATLPSGTRMRTRSDCEVLLHLYRSRGMAFLDDVRGMFAIVLWDRRAGQLVMARDRFGIKPLYVHRTPERVVAGSEIKTLFTDEHTPRRIDWTAALSTQALAAAPRLADETPCTWFEGVELVPAGTIWRTDLRDGATSEHCYWRLEDHWDQSDLSRHQLVATYRELLEASVRECASADTELGLFLSGGIDSATVLAMAVGQIPDIHTFSVVSPSTIANGDADASRLCADHFGVPNHAVGFPEGLVPTADQWRRLLWLVETPMCGPEVYYKHELHRYARRTRPELRGMLLGAASDEFNGGYSADIAGGGDWQDFEAGLGDLAVQTDLHRRPSLSAWWLAGPPFLREDAIHAIAGRETGWTPYHRYLKSEHRKIQQYNVWHEDRTAAGSGTEARVPFLDHRLVELVAGVRRSDRPDLLWDKRILREAVAGMLPPSIVSRPKVPFFYGPGTNSTYDMVLDLLQRGDRELVEQALAAPGAADFLDPGALHRGLTDLARGSSDSPRVELLLRLVNLGLLADMVSAVPRLWDRHPGPVASVVPAPAQTYAARDALRSDDVLVLAEHTRLVRDDQSWYLLGDGVVEYDLEPDSTTLAVLCDLDGADLASVTARSGVALDTVHADLTRLVADGLVLRLDAQARGQQPQMPASSKASAASMEPNAPAVAK